MKGDEKTCPCAVCGVALGPWDGLIVRVDGPAYGQVVCSEQCGSVVLAAPDRYRVTFAAEEHAHNKNSDTGPSLAPVPPGKPG